MPERKKNRPRRKYELNERFLRFAAKIFPLYIDILHFFGYDMDVNEQKLRQAAKIFPSERELWNLRETFI